jgi:Ser/Thr protein kinase RdoA (MazF antagonist)
MNMVAKTHGMDGTLVEPDWPPLTLEEVRAVLTQFSGLAEPVEILSVSPRPFSAGSLVATHGGRMFVKRHHRTVRNTEGLLEEHRFMAHLCAHGGAVPRVFATASGHTAIEDGEWTYEIHEAPEGVDLYEDAISWTPFFTAAHAYSAGQALARLHEAARGFDDPPRKPRPLVASFTIFAAADAENAMKHYLATRPSLAAHAATRHDCDRALELLEPFHAELLPLAPALAPLWTHNDLHGSNLIWSDRSEAAKAVAVIDFGLADRTNAVHDLAQAIERSIVEWLVWMDDPAHADNVPVHFDHLHALLEGYESVHMLAQEEAAALAPMTALCHAEFALTETDYFLGVLRSAEKARVASDGYLVGHARWFRSTAGGRLLDALRRWAAGRKRKMVRA